MDAVDKLTDSILNYERFIEVEDYETRKFVNDLIIYKSVGVV